MCLIGGMGVGREDRAEKDCTGAEMLCYECWR